MEHDFSTKAHYSQASITVPPLSMESIRGRARAARSHARARALIVSATAVIALVGAGAGAKVADGMRVWLFGNIFGTTAHAGSRDIRVLLYPMAGDLHESISGATFPVVFPLGVPPESRIRSIARIPAEHPSIITIVYENGSGSIQQFFLLMDPAVVSTDGSSLPPGTAVVKVRDGNHWMAGREIVLTNGGTFGSPRDLARIRAAMMASTPARSFAAVQPLLAQLPVLGDKVHLAIAERYRPALGRSVLIDIAYVSPQLKAHKPLLDSRTIDRRWSGKKLVYSTTANGPRSKTIVVSVDGVSAISAVLRSMSVNPDTCRCEILFNEHNSGTYWLWTIPLSGPGAVRKFVVNAKTFDVAPLAVP